MSRASFIILAFTSWLALAGCANDAPPAPTDSSATGGAVNAQLVEVVPPLKDQRFSTLLDFESQTDGVFLSSKPPARMDYERAHTGKRSARFDDATPRFSIKLASLLSGRAFPGDWTLVGGFIFCEKPITVKVAVESAGFAVPSRIVSLAPNRWTLALVDISAAIESVAGAEARDAKPLPDSARITFTLPRNSPPVWFDDLLLIDNTQSLVTPHPPSRIADARPTATTTTTTKSATNESAPAAPSAAWAVTRRGLSYIGDSPGHFSFKLVTTEAAADGWTVEEANDLRARFTSTGPTKSLTIYADGRSFWDGVFKPLSSEARTVAFVDQHASPADIAVPQELGRVARNTPGDANNDGYNEHRGAYEVVATEARLELRITPRTSVVVRPILEVTGLPPGRVLVTIEGQLVERQTRLDDGTLLVELPARIDRPTTVNLRIQ